MSSVKTVRKKGKYKMVATLNRCSISQLASEKQMPGFYVVAFSPNKLEQMFWSLNIVN